jgi:hypothetical protein
MVASRPKRLPIEHPVLKGRQQISWRCRLFTMKRWGLVCIDFRFCLIQAVGVNGRRYACASLKVRELDAVTIILPGSQQIGNPPRGRVFDTLPLPVYRNCI